MDVDAGAMAPGDGSQGQPGPGTPAQPPLKRSEAVRDLLARQLQPDTISGLRNKGILPSVTLTVIRCRRGRVWEEVWWRGGGAGPWEGRGAGAGAGAGTRCAGRTARCHWLCGCWCAGCGGVCACGLVRALLLFVGCAAVGAVLCADWVAAAPALCAGFANAVRCVAVLLTVRLCSLLCCAAGGIAVGHGYAHGGGRFAAAGGCTEGVHLSACL